MSEIVDETAPVTAEQLDYLESRWNPPAGQRTRKLSEIVQELLSRGWHPAQIRKELAKRNIRWRYAFAASHQGKRETLRRLKQRWGTLS